VSGLPTEGEWAAHRAFYDLTVAQRDAAWRESEVLRNAIRTLLQGWGSDEWPDDSFQGYIDELRTTLARIEEFVP
jgi:hypothetical protein